MTSSAHRRAFTAKAMLVLSIAATAILGLSGCVGTPAPSPSSSHGPGPGPGSGPGDRTPAATSPTESPTPDADATANPATPLVPVTVSCSQLITPQTMYDFNPNFGLLDAYKPKAGTPGAMAVAKKGIACSWLNQTSRDTIEISVAHLADPELTSLRNGLNSSSKAVTDFGSPGYFTVSAGVGTAQAFSGPYWIAASSTFFGAPSDAASLVKAAMASLGK